MQHLADMDRWASGDITQLIVRRGVETHFKIVNESPASPTISNI